LFLFILLTLVCLLPGGCGCECQIRLLPDCRSVVQVPKYDPGRPRIKDPKGSHPRGSVVPVTIPGEISGVGDLPASVYLPPQYYDNPEQKFPVLYMYHGVPGVPGVQIPGMSGTDGPESMFSATDVDGAALVAAQQGHPVVLIAPVVSLLTQDSECVDGSQRKWQPSLSVDVIAWAKSNPRFLTGAEHSGTGGFSMGGFCSIVTALRNPDVFSVVGNLSGTTSPDYMLGNDKLFSAGQDMAATLLTYDAIHIVNTDPKSHSVRVWQDVGANDAPTLIQMQGQFDQTASGLGMTVVSNVEPNQQHTFTFWTAAFAQYIPWAADLLHKPLPVTEGQRPPADAERVASRTATASSRSATHQWDPEDRSQVASFRGGS
jgi:S-formylglutathione hydrolase FrmB